MPRQVRIEYAGAVYHLMARGNRRAKIYLGDGDRERFLKNLGTACSMTGWEVLAWVLMPNHYHLVIRTPQANLVEGMRWLQNAYTRYFNTRHKQWGRLFGDRYKSILVDAGGRSPGRELGEGSPDYLSTLIDYVHLNPARARLIDPTRGDSIRDYRWSSVAKGYACAPSKRPNWLEAASGLKLHDLPDTVAGRRHYVEGLDTRIKAEGAARAGRVKFEGQTLQSTLRRGWYWGGEAFRERMLSLLEEKPTKNANYRSSAQGHDHAEAMAQSILEQGVDKLGLDPGPDGKPQAKRGDRRRHAIAWAIWRCTSVPQSWIANHLGLVSPGNVSQQIRVFEAIPTPELSRDIQKWKAKYCQKPD